MLTDGDMIVNRAVSSLPAEEKTKFVKGRKINIECRGEKIEPALTPGVVVREKNLWGSAKNSWGFEIFTGIFCILYVPLTVLYILSN